jgi:hypothetical protein
MKRLVTALSLCVGGLFLRPAEAATITVTTTNNASPPAGQTSFAQALAAAKSGDTIAFNIPGGGPHYIATPPAPNPVDRGYPLIRAHNLTIDGYTQPGSSPNSNPILFANNAKIKIFLDSRQGEATLMNFDGYGPTEAGILPVVGATNVMVRGLGFLGQLITQPSILNPAVYCVAFGQGARGHVNGCWFGVDADGKTVYGANAGVTGFRFVNDVTGVPFFADNTAIGVKPGSSGADEQFNVIVGMKIPIIIEGSGLRVSGNFIGVLPSGRECLHRRPAAASLPAETSHPTWEWRAERGAAGSLHLRDGLQDRLAVLHLDLELDRLRLVAGHELGDLLRHGARHRVVGEARGVLVAALLRRDVGVVEGAHLRVAHRAVSPPRGYGPMLAQLARAPPTPLDNRAAQAV